MKHCVVLRRIAGEEKSTEYDVNRIVFCWESSNRFTVFPNHAAAAYALEREKAAGNAWGESRIVSLKELVDA